MAQHSFLNIFLVSITVFFAIVVQQNPLLFGRKVSNDSNSYKIYSHHPVLEQHLQQFRSDEDAVMSEHDYVAYRNHCLRVLTFAVYHCAEACGTHEVDLMAMALAYHDVALWSDKKLNYLTPSVRRMELQANKQDTGADQPAIWNKQDIATATEIILQHHKVTDWRGEDNNASAAILVNAVRKGDWADATMGLVRFGLPASLLERAYEQIPEAGFHRVLLDMGPRLSPDSLVGQLDVFKILKW